MPTSPFHDTEYPADPYPGARPATSYVHIDEHGWVLTPDADTDTGWAVVTERAERIDLNAWLDQHQAAPIEQRLPVLAYGSNACPSKVSWLRENHGLTGPAIVLRAHLDGAAAVWSAGTRARDGQRPAVLAAMSGISETHAVWWATPQQRRVIDQGEGRGQRYRLAWVRLPTRLDDGTAYEWVLAYTARPEVIGQGVPIHLNRSPLLRDGELVRVDELDQQQALLLPTDPADRDGLTCVEVTEPDPTGPPSSDRAH